MKKICTVLFFLFCCTFGMTGCGGGGGGGGGVLAPVTPTSSKVNISGTVDVPPQANSGWGKLASVRADFSRSTLLIRATGVAGTQLGDGVSVSEGGAFSLTIDPDEKVLLECSNANGFKYYKNLGKVASDQISVVIDATSTVEVTFEEIKLQEDLPGFSKASLLEAFLQALASAPAADIGSSKSVLDQLKTEQTIYRDKVQVIKNAAKDLQSGLSQENLDLIVNNFSTEFGSSRQEIANLVNFADFKSVTQDRFRRYQILSHTIDIQKVTFPEPDKAISVLTSHIIAKNEENIGDDRDVAVSDWSVTWRLENGKWLIYRDFPYRSEQFQTFTE